MVENISGEVLIKEHKLEPVAILCDAHYAMQKLRVALNNNKDALARTDRDTPELITHMDYLSSGLEGLEAYTEKALAGYAATYDIWPWFRKVKGIGPMMASNLLNYIGNPERFATISKLWAYAGLAVVDGHAQKRAKGEKMNWNPGLKVACWKIGGQLLKAHSPYCEVYYQAKMFYEAQAVAKGLKVVPAAEIKKGHEAEYISEGHIHNKALRKMVKRFLADLWVNWRTLRELPVSAPYAIAIMGHSDYEKPVIGL